MDIGDESERSMSIEQANIRLCDFLKKGNCLFPPGIFVRAFSCTYTYEHLCRNGTEQKKKEKKKKETRETTRHT